MPPGKTAMNLLDFVNRPPSPEPWSEGEKIPWNEPSFSARMLKEHLNQQHDAASRRSDKIDKHIAWIHGCVLQQKRVKVLDLGCGPGLYTQRLTQLGHECVGIDFSPASIAYAAANEADREEQEQVRSTYLLQDIREADYGNGYGLVMLIFGEFNVFSPGDAKAILCKAHTALDPGGALLIEPQTESSIFQEGNSPRSWYSSPSGLFSDKPHICLTENFWDETSKTTSIRYWIINATTGQIARYSSTTQAYSQEELQSMLTACGFSQITFYPSLTGQVDDGQPDLFALTARKAA
jgi:SAM-dependent methyltransferase